MSEIKWNLPGPNEEGFLRRKRDLAELLDADPSPANIEATMDFLLAFVVEPKTKKAAKEALLDISQVDYGKAIMRLIYGSFSVPDPKAGKSVPQ